MDECIIHTLKLAESLQKELKGEFLNSKKWKYERLLIYLFDCFLGEEKAKIIENKKEKFLKSCEIQIGDLLETKDGRIVSVKKVLFDNKNSFLIDYQLIKNDLQLSKRSRRIEIENFSYKVDKELFEEFSSKGFKKHISLLAYWIKRNKKKLKQEKFELNFIETLINS